MSSPYGILEKVHREPLADPTLQALREVQGLLALLAISTGFYVSRQDQIFLNSWNANASLTGVRIQARYLMPNGDVKTLLYNQVPNTDRSQATSTFRPPQNAYLLGLMVVDIGTIGQRGETWIQAGFTSNDGDSRNLIQDYLFAGYRPSWPEGAQVGGPLEGRGRLVLQQDETADDNDKEFTVPTNARWTPISMLVIFTATSTAGTRELEVTVKDAADTVFAGYGITSGITLSQTARWLLTGIGRGDFGSTRALSDGSAGNPNVSNVDPFPVDQLRQGFDVRVVDVANIAAGFDDLLLRLFVEERIEE